MAEDPTPRKRTLSHKEYLDTLHRPSTAEVRRIAEIQLRKECEIDSKYHRHTAEEHEAATKIQKAYRDHRERRQLDGLALDPSARWMEAAKEWRYRSAIAPHYRAALSEDDGRALPPSDLARLNWRRVGQIAEHAGAGESNPSQLPGSELEPEAFQAAISILLDLRYFLELVDCKHRYGTNLQVYHEKWRRSDTHDNFFNWLDYGEGKYLSLTGCSREKLDRERIRYLSKEERKDYLVRVDNEGKLRWEKNDELITTSVEEYKDSIHGIVPKDSNEPAFSNQAIQEKLAQNRRLSPEMSRSGDVGHGKFADVSNEDNSASGSGSLEERLAHQQATKDKTQHKHVFYVSPATIPNYLLRASVKPGTWIYVADTVGRLYVGIKSSGAFQHASFLSGARISSAGSIGIENGQLVYLSPLSGHYRPTTKSFKAFIESQKKQGVDLSKLKVSHTYQVLLGMEYYGRAKSSISRIVHHKKAEDGRPPGPSSDELYDARATATGVVEQLWHDEHKHGIGKLMNDLHIKRRSFSTEHKRGEI